MEKLKEEMRTQVLDELRKAFPEECVIDWKEFKKENPAFNYKFESNKVEEYVDFVNKHILRKDEK